MQRVSHHKVDEANLEAVIFDVDGTLVDSMPLFFKSWCMICQRNNLSFTEKEFYSCAGLNVHDIIHKLHVEQKGGPPSEEFVTNFRKTKKETFKAVIAEHGRPTAIECVVAIAKEMQARGIKIGAASSGLRNTVLTHLKHCELLELFKDEAHIVVAGDLPKGRGKPKPDIFLEAARRLGVHPSKCRAFEDGESGLRAAYEAGMEVIDVRELEGYPISDALRECLPTLKASRHWLLLDDSEDLE